MVLVAVLTSNQVQADDFRYEPDWDSIRSRHQVSEWFRDAKFGIFLHWGPYAVPAFMSDKCWDNCHNKAQDPQRPERLSFRSDCFALA